jgi:hypothetical protein
MGTFKEVYQMEMTKIKIENDWDHSGFGDYKLEGSWGAISHNILTECYAGGCENNTLIALSHNHIEFLDNHGDTIHTDAIMDMKLWVLI